MSSQCFDRIVVPKTLINDVISPKYSNAVDKCKPLDWNFPEYVPKAGRDISRRELEISENAFVIITIGNNGAIKDDLIDAMYSLLREEKDCIWLLVGSPAPDYLRLTCKELIEISARQWMKTPLYTEKQLEEQRRQRFEQRILFSIVTPLYNTPEEFLRDMVDSVIAQTYSNWELCLADGSDTDHEYVKEICLEYARSDDRVKYRKLERNLGISGNSNACIDMATGDYICILDHDDIMHPAALHEVMESVCMNNADIVYTDEAVFCSPDPADIYSVHFKPDFAPDNLRANNYIRHFLAFRQTLIDSCGAFREDFDGSRDHDLILRLSTAADRIEHIPEVLYYCRLKSESAAENTDNKACVGEAGKKAVLNNLERNGIGAKVECHKDYPTIYKVSYELPDELPKVSIIIPNCDHTEDLRCCIESIKEKTTYADYEIIVVENNSSGQDIFKYYEEIESEYGVRIVRWPGKGFNWAEINNYAIRGAAGGDYLLLLNNDTEIISPEWIEEMLMHAHRPEVGAVGAMLYYPDDTIQHAGVIIGLGKVAGHAFKNIKRGESGYMGRLLYAQNMSAVTGACMMLRRDVFEEVGGFDENYAVSYNDVDFCMKVREAGYLVVWTPHAELYHYESKSRGLYYDTPEKIDRDRKECDRFRKRWANEMAAGDPYYNPNFSYRKSFVLHRKKRTENLWDHSVLRIAREAHKR